MPLEDTIIALSSSPGPAARGILRLSGPAAAAVSQKIFHPVFRAGSAQIILQGSLTPWGEKRSIPAKLFFWPEHRGYTGGETVEIHTIGSPPLLNAVLSAVLEAGLYFSYNIRSARPGEFTLRAFLSGRIDLTRAEAVLGVIDATSKHSLETALKQLAGNLAAPIRQAREALMETLAHLEAGLDFAEEEIEFVTPDEIRNSLRRVLDRIGNLRARMDARSLSSEIQVVVLAGPPNSGKSTLFNVLSETEHALVSSRPGTTRDYLEAKVRFDDVPCLLVDTAGIDETRLDDIDDRARRLSTEAIEKADLILHCIPSDRRAGDGVPDTPKTLNIRTKSDLSKDSFPDAFPVSAKTGFGIAPLRREIADRLVRTRSYGDVVPGTASRCRESLDAAAFSLQGALENMELSKQILYDDSLLALEIRQALDALGLVDGSVHTEDILDRIFERFCIGK